MNPPGVEANGSDAPTKERRERRQAGRRHQCAVRLNLDEDEKRCYVSSGERLKMHLYNRPADVISALSAST